VTETISPKPFAASRIRVWRRFLSIAIPLAIVGLVVLSLAQATSKKMHHNMTWGAYTDFESISVAISEMVYHLHHGYLAYGEIINLFEKRLGGNTPPGEIPHIERMTDARYINATIREATSLDQISIVAPRDRFDFSPIIHRYLVPIIAEDVGRVDYYRVAFSLFGFRIQSMHFLFFLVLMISTVLFIVGFNGQVVPLSVLAANLIAVNLVINSHLFFESLPSISAYRAVSALAIIPISHLIFCVFNRARIWSLAGLSSLGQVTLFIFVLWARSSAQWGFAAVLLATFLIAIRQRAWRNFRRLTLWPLAALIVGELALSIYAHNALSPAYFTDELLPSHFTWHSAYLGLKVPNPGDDFAFLPAAKYIAKSRPDLPETAPLTNSYWLRLHDQAVRHLFFEFVSAHPRYMLELYTWRKPALFVNIYCNVMTPLMHGFLLAGLLTIVILGSAATLLLRTAWLHMTYEALTITGITALASYIPIMWAYPAQHVMVDSVWTTTAFLLLLATTVGGAIIRLVQALADRSGPMWRYWKRLSFGRRPI
jgi:hypothetical protein